MSKTAADMLIEAGLVPEDTVKQLIKWRALPESTLERVGRQPVSLEKDSKEAAKFAEDLSQQLEREERTLRETVLDVHGDEHKVFVQFLDGMMSETVVAVVDAFGKIHIPASVLPNGRMRTIKGVSFDGSPENIKKVGSQESVYQGDVVSSVVCQLEPGWNE